MHTNPVSRYPLGSGVTWNDLEVNPYPILERLRREEPVTWLAPLGGWALTTHTLCEHMLRSQDLFETHKDGSKPHEIFGSTMLSSDDAEHRRQRDPFEHPFRLRPTRELYTDMVEEHTRELIDEFASWREVELSDAFASRLPVRVIGSVLGVDMDPSDIRAAYDAFAAALGDYKGDADVDRRAGDARSAFDASLRQEISRIRDSDRTGALGDALDEALSDDEVIANALVIFFGGIETVETLILNTITALLTHPEQFEEVVRDPSLIPNAIDEALRWAPPLGFIGRRARAATQIGGVDIAAGDFVCAVILAANRDPAVFDDPDAFDIHRPNARRLLSFSHGAHFCLGFNLAKLEAATAVRQLIERLPGMELDGPAEPRGFAFRRPAAVHLRWDSPKI